MQTSKEMVHIRDIRPGDCVEHQGKLMTVGRHDLKRGFMGMTLFGDSYRLGTVLVVKATPVHVMPNLNR